MVVLLSDDAIIAIIIIIVLIILYICNWFSHFIERLEDRPHEWGSEKESKKRLNAFGTI